MAFEIKNDNRDANLGSVGGSGNSVCAGEFCPGPQIAAQGNYAGGIGSHKDLRGGSARAGSGYNQGSQFAASTGGGGAGKIPGTSMGSAARTGKPGSAKESVSYTQGDQFAASKK